MAPLSSIFVVALLPVLALAAPQGPVVSQPLPFPPVATAGFNTTLAPGPTAVSTTAPPSIAVATLTEGGFTALFTYTPPAFPAGGAAGLLGGGLNLPPGVTLPASLVSAYSAFQAASGAGATGLPGGAAAFGGGFSLPPGATLPANLASAYSAYSAFQAASGAGATGLPAAPAAPVGGSGSVDTAVPAGAVIESGATQPSVPTAIPGAILGST